MKSLKERIEEAKLRAKIIKQKKSADEEGPEKVIDHVSRPNFSKPKEEER